MVKSIEFPWRYFLETGLKIEDKMTGGIFEFINLNLRDKKFIELKSNCHLNGSYRTADNIIPLIVDPEKLTKEQWIYIATGKNNVDNDCEVTVNSEIIVVDIFFSHILEYYPKTCSLFCGIDVLERMHECHSMPQYKELLKAGLIKDAGDVYA